MMIFICIALVGLVFLIISAIFGGHEMEHEVHFEHGLEVGADSDSDSDSAGGPSPFSFRVISIFLCGFGAIGAITRSYGVSYEICSLLGLAGGLLFGFFGWLLIRGFWKNQASSIIRSADIKGSQGTVTTAIPVKGLMEKKIKDYVSEAKYEVGKPDTLIIRCSDHKLRVHFEEFLAYGLGLEENSYDLLVVPGGPQFFFSDDSAFPKYSWAGRNWLKFLVEKHGLKNIILMAHYDCGWYKFLSFGKQTPEILKAKQIDDLRRIPARIKEALPQVNVQMFYAQPEGGHVRFTEI